MTLIGVHAPTYSPRFNATLDAIGQALDVSFARRRLGDDRDLSGWIVLSADRKIASEVGRTTKPCYVVVDDAELLPAGESSKITFTNRVEVAPILRGRDVTADDAVGAKALPHWLPQAVPLATKGGAAIWAIQDQGCCRHHHVSLRLPELTDGDALYTHFSGQRIACLLPLVLFLRSLGEDQRWQAPPLQATFMFDDPNLHWTSYGFVEYGDMVRRAVAGGYHVSVATIPLDAWFVHPPACDIFQQNPDYISLLYHGNNHVFRELARSQSAEAMQCTLRQAVARIARLEARTGLEVARVMAPPHGACSEVALAEMAGLGFEAVCVSRGSLQYHNAGAAWTRTIGMKPCDMVAGLTVIPRFRLSKNCANDILIAALLRQPIVPMTHHQAVADGYDLLDQTASFVNSLGAVSWRDMRTVSRSLYSHRHDDRTLLVRMLSKRITVAVPEGTTRLLIERPWLEDSSRTLFWRTTAADQRWSVVLRCEGIAVQPGTTIEIASGAAAADRTETSIARLRFAPVARRALTEVRDRALPSIHRLARKSRASAPK